MTFAVQHPAYSPIPEASAFPGHIVQSLSQRAVGRPLRVGARGGVPAPPPPAGKGSVVPAADDRVTDDGDHAADRL